jgi:hypothetical protein
MMRDWFDILMQNAVYVLWITLILVLLLIVNNRYKARQHAKLAKRNPEIRLFPFEYTSASGTITFFFDADETLDYRFFIQNSTSSEKHIIAQGKCKKGGQKIQFDTTTVENGVYYYGLETEFQRTEKRVEVRN